MAHTQDKFAYLFDLVTPGGGPHLFDLLEPKNVKMAASLMLHDAARFAALEAKVGNSTVRAKWLKAVKDNAKHSVEDAAKERMEEALGEALDAAREAGKAVLDKGRPVDIAEAFRAAVRPHLLHLGEHWLDYQNGSYVAVENREITSALQAFMRSGVDSETGEPYVVGPREVEGVTEALRNDAFVHADRHDPPCWLRPDDFDPDPRMVISTTNGLLDISSGQLMPHTPRFFTRNALGYAYDPAATAPMWDAFLESCWPDAEGGAENKAALQEIFGYLLTNETGYQKIFMFIGAPNAGKGVIARIIELLLGPANVATQTVVKLGKDFGLKILLGKQALVVPDLRLGKGIDLARIVEMLLSISGEDRVAVGRKHEDDVNLRLHTRIVLVANMEIVLPDQTGAMRRRLVPLVFPKSFEGKEDIHLTEKLATELPGILNWALEGLRRLDARRDPETGRQKGFVLTTAGAKMVQSIARRGSPVNTFLREACDLRPGALVPRKRLYNAFEMWCTDNGEESLHTEETFGRELRVASGYGVEDGRPRINGKPVWHYKGVALKPEWAYGGL